MRLVAIMCWTSGQVRMWYSESGVEIMPMSLGLRWARKAGHSVVRSEGGTLICQYGRHSEGVVVGLGVMLPIVPALVWVGRGGGCF